MSVRLKLEDSREGMVATISQHKDAGKIIGPLDFSRQRQGRGKEKSESARPDPGIEELWYRRQDHYRRSPYFLSKFAPAGTGTGIAADSVGHNAAKDPTMQIRLGCELVCDYPQPVAMMLLLTVDHTRAADLLAPDRLVAVPPIPVHVYRDGFAN